MPIRPENKARYPKDWKRIADAIRERAGDCCEGSPAYPDCRVPNRTIGYWLDGTFVQMPRALREAGYTKGDVVACNDGSFLKLVEIVLTVAHLDHTPENCDDDNLRAMCQRCHLTYDADHHRETAYATRKAAANTCDMFDTLTATPTAPTKPKGE